MTEQHSPERAASEMRARGALLHVAKCAGTALSEALLDAAGRPGQPAQPFDRCYLAGFHRSHELDEDVRRLVAWDDITDIPSDYVFRQHWSLPTLRSHFDAADIVTLLREPMMRVISYVEFARSAPQWGHRAWLPENLPSIIARTPFVALFDEPRTARMLDNLICRQVLWGDHRLPELDWLANEHIDKVAADATDALRQLAVVGVVEAMGAAWADISAWFGAALRPARHNETPDRQNPGLFTRPQQVARALDHLVAHTAADRQVWSHFAGAAGVDTRLDSCIVAADERLGRLCTTAFFGQFVRADVAPATAASTTNSVASPIAATLAELPGDARPVVIDVAVSDLAPHCHDWLVVATDDHAAGEAAARTGRAVRVVDRDLIDYGALLSGQDVNGAVVGPLMSARTRADLFSQLAGALGPDGQLVVIVRPADMAWAINGIDQAGWHPVGNSRLDDHSAMVIYAAANPTKASWCPPAARQSAGAVSHYAIPIDLTRDDDSRSLVVRMATGPRVLELGASQGLMTEIMRGRGQDVWAVEIDPEAALAARRFATRIAVGDLDDPTLLDAFAGETFDSIILADVLEHLRQPEACFALAMRHLAPGGRAIISLPNAVHADVRLAILDGDVPYADLGLLDRTHIQWFTYRRMMAMLAANGFVVTEWRRTMRPIGETEVPFRRDPLVSFGVERFGTDPHALTYQWIVAVGRAGEVPSVDDPMAVTSASDADRRQEQHEVRLRRWRRSTQGGHRPR